MVSRDMSSGRLSRVSTGVGSSSASDRGMQRAQERLSKIAQLRTSKSAAKSAAHEGVVERPMDTQISKILQMKRDQLKQRGSSVYRLREHEGEDEQALYEEDLRGTSAARTKTPLGDMPLVRLPPGVLRPKRKSM